MSSIMKLFNFVFLKENIKKSKGIIIFFSFLVPLFTFLNVYLVSKGLSQSQSKFMIDLLNMSIPSIVFMYIVPIIVSIALFNFVFKRKSVDLIASFPIKRSTIYLTNLTGAILIFTGILIVSILLILVNKLIFPSLVISLIGLLKYFIVMLIGYTFVYSCASLALTVTGNMIVQIIITFLLMFMIPFYTDYGYSKIYTNDNRYYQNYQNHLDNYFRVSNVSRFDANFNLPYKYIRIVPTSIMNANASNSNNDLNELYNPGSLFKTGVLSLIYLVLGVYLFKKRKMEIAEETFLNKNYYYLLKALTIIPYYLLLFNIRGFFLDTGFIFIFSIGIVLYFLIDLITKKGIIGNPKNFITIFIILLLAFSLNLASKYLLSPFGEKVILQEDVDTYGISLISNNQFGDKLLDVKLNDQKLLSLIFSEFRKEYIVSPNEKESFSTTINLKLNLKNGKSYYFASNENESVVKAILTYLSNNEDYNNIYQNINLDNVFNLEIIGIPDRDIDKSYVYSLINKDLEKINASKVYVSRYSYDLPYNYRGQSKAYLKLNTNESGTYRMYLIDSNFNQELFDYITTLQNKTFLEYITYNQKYIGEFYVGGILDFYVSNSDKDYVSEIIDFILKDKEGIIDPNNSIIIQFTNYQNNFNYVYNIRNVDAFKEMVKDYPFGYDK